MTRLLESPEISYSLAEERPLVGLQQLAALFSSLNDAGIRYCHWKSNLRLAKSLKGQTDLDLLVDRVDEARFRQKLLAHKIKPTLAAPGKAYPGVEHYLGFDRATGRMFHLHIHYHLILGEQFVKNYRLPLERQFLDSTRLSQGIKTPAVELELIVLALRALLKYRDRDAWQALLRSDNHGGLPEAIIDEFRHLLDQTDRSHVVWALEEQAPFLPAATILSMIETVSQPQVDGSELFRLRRSVLQALKPYQRFSRLQARLNYYQAAIVQSRPFKLTRRFWRSPKQRQTLTSGGFTFAVAGADGAGKSTVIRETVRWLTWRLTVNVFYLGSSQPGFIAAVLKKGAGFLGKAHAGARRFLGRRSFLTRLLWQGRMMIKNLSYIAVGRDRYRRFVAGQRSASNGAIVIYDRYPLPQLSVNGRPVDGPRIAYTNSAPLGRFTASLARIEENYYHQIPKPENMLVLQVSPEISLARKPDHNWEEVEAKCRAMKYIKADDSNMIVVDADQPLEQVLGQVKENLWRLL